ncbi:MAG: NfeD family protein [Planctomycetota bacterium]
MGVQLPLSALSLSFVLTLILLPVIFFQNSHQTPYTKERVVYYLKIDREINDSLYLFLKKHFNLILEMNKQNDKKIFLLIEFNTPGGALSATFNIIKLFDKLDDEKITTIAYINNQALSAGAIISLSCRKLYMASGSNIGSAAPILMGPFGLMPLGEYKEKIVSAVRSLMASRAQKYNRHPVILEAMVDDSFEIYKVTLDNGDIKYLKEYEVSNLESSGDTIAKKELIKPKNMLINLTDKQAEEYQVSQGTVSSIEQILKLEFGDESPPLIREVKKGVDDYFLELLESDIVASILAMIGLGALFTFFKTGSITTLVIAITCLGFTPLVKFILGLSGPVAFYLILLGVVLVLLEVFIIPGTTIIGILGIASIIVGIIMNFGTITPPEIPKIAGFSNAVLMYTTITLVGSLLLFFIAIKLLPSVPVVNTLILEGGLHEKAIEPNVTPQIQAGIEGITLTECKPIGLVDFNGYVVECEAVGEFVKRNQKIEVINVSGNKIYIREKIS